MKPIRRTPRPTPRRRPALPTLVALALALGAPLALVARGAPAQQTGTALFLPDLQSGEKSASALFRPLGQEGFADSQVLVQNQAEAANSVQLDLVPKSSTDPATLKRSLGARKAVKLDLAAESSVPAGFFSGRLGGSQALGAIARLRWVSGAGVAYEAVPAAKDLILPLVARTVYSHTTIISMHNTDRGPDKNEITVSVFDRNDGHLLNEALFEPEPDEGVTADVGNMPNTFGSRVLGSNAPTGGWLGSAWFHAEKPIAVLAYGDELEGLGSSAYVARAVSEAGTEQLLPLVRSNFHGDTLIAVANAGNKAVDVTLEYRGADFSPSGAGQTFTQRFGIGPRGTTFVDLSTRQRGTAPAVALPRGAGADRGFVGSARLTASGPVLAVAQDETLKAGRVDTVSAYGAFGAGDLGTVWGLPGLRKAAGYLSTTLVLQNPGPAAVAATVDLWTASDQAAGQADVSVPARGLAWLRLADLSAFPAGAEGRGILRADGPLAVLVAQERDTSEDPSGKVHTVDLPDLLDQGISGQATLTEKGADLEVALAMKGTSPGLKYPAMIRYGKCLMSPDVAYPLDDVVNGKSTTTLRGLSMATLVATEHSLVVQAPGGPGRPTLDAACGLITELHTAEKTDGELASAVRLVAAAVTPATPGATTPAPSATPTGVRATDTPSPTPPPPTASATATDEGGEVRVFLPYAYSRR